MRIAVLVIGLCLVMLVGMQSCTVMFGGGLTEDQNLAGAGALGQLVALLFILGSAFAIGAPKASVGIFAVAALFAFGAAGMSDFRDMNVWGWISVVLAVLSYFGIREKAKKELAK